MKKITFDKADAEKIAKVSQMLKLMVGSDYVEAQKARDAFAALIQKPIVEVIQAGAVLGSLFSTMSYSSDELTMIPLDSFFDIRQADLFHVWSQSRPGGLTTNQLFNQDQLPVSVYSLDAAVSLPLSYVRSASLDVVARYLNKASQEVLAKQEANSMSVIAAVAAQSQYLNKGTAAYQVLRSKTQGYFVPQDLNALDTLMARVNTPGVGGTPVGSGRSVTTLILSPEAMENIKNMVFEPLNTKSVSVAYPLGGPEKFRDEIYASPNAPSFMGRELVDVYDMGVGQLYNILLSNYAGSNAYAGYGGSGTAVFAPGSEQFMIGIDRRQEFLVRVVQTNPDDSSELAYKADNQWSNRSETVGFWMRVTEGRVALDGRNIVSLVF